MRIYRDNSLCQDDITIEGVKYLFKIEPRVITIKLPCTYYFPYDYFPNCSFIAIENIYIIN